MPDFYQMYHDFLYKDAQLPPSFFKLAQSKIEEEVKPILKGTDVKVIYLNSKFEGISNKTHPFKKCLAGPWYIFVGTDGTVYHCCDLGLNCQVAIGNLLNDTLQEIWLSETRKKVTEFINSEGLETLCPPICALHDLNKLFSELENLLNQAGDRKQEVESLLSREIDELKREIIDKKCIDPRDPYFIS